MNKIFLILLQLYNNTKGAFMSDEIKEEKKCCNCYYVSDGYKRFLVGMLSSFIGCLVALSLYHGGLYPQTPSPCYCQSYEMYEFDEYPEMENEDISGQVEHKKFAGKHKKFEHKKPPVKNAK